MSTTSAPTRITVSTQIDRPIERVWQRWTDPKDIVNWNAASDDWHCPHAENDLRVGGSFKSRMAPRGSDEGFDFRGTYDEVVRYERIVYTMDDGRRCEVTFNPTDTGTSVIETFDAEGTNSIEMQRGGWQAILDRFKQYVEGHE